MPDLEVNLKQLHLPTVNAHYREFAEEARREGSSYEEYLDGLMGREIEHRRDTRTARWLRDSRLPLEKSLEHFDQSRLPAKVRSAVSLLIEGRFLDRAENVLAFGNPGSGKTHLLAGIAQELIHRGHRVLFQSCQLLVQDLRVPDLFGGIPRPDRGGLASGRASSPYFSPISSRGARDVVHSWDLLDLNDAGAAGAG